MKTIALIPARGGSKGIKRKNIKLFNSKPLIYWSIKAGLESKYIDEVIVSTEDNEIAEIARSYSALVPFMRPQKLAKDDSPGIDPVLNALEELPYVKDLILLQPTSPLRKSIHIDEIFELRKKFKADSAVSLSKSKKPFIYKLNEECQMSPLSSSLKLLPRQKLTDLYSLNGAMYLSNRKFILKNKSLISKDTIGYIMAEKYSIDIDTDLDWELAEYLMKK